VSLGEGFFIFVLSLHLSLLDDWCSCMLLEHLACFGEVDHSFFVEFVFVLVWWGVEVCLWSPWRDSRESPFSADFATILF